MTQQTLWLIESALITQAPEMPFSLPTAVLQDMQVGNTVAIKKYSKQHRRLTGLASRDSKTGSDSK